MDLKGLSGGLCFFLSFAFFSGNINAQALKYSNEFLSIGVGARALGMSNATVASVSDVTSGYWNPAGLRKVTANLELALMHSEYFAGIGKFDYGAACIPIDSMGTAGFSFIRFGVDDIPNTLFLVNPDGSFDYSKITSFSVADYAFLFSYARDMKIKGLSVGANAKVIHRKAGEFARAWGFGLDLGAQYSIKKWQLGAMCRDITTTFNSWKYSFNENEKAVLAATGNEIPDNSVETTLPKLILGAAYAYSPAKNFSVQPELNVDVTFDGMRNVLVKSDPVSFDPHFGLEIGYRGLVYLRGGVFNIQQVKNFDGEKIYTMQPNFGVGIRLKNISIDYALANIGSQGEIPYSNVFSLKLNFFKKRKYNFD